MPLSSSPPQQCLWHVFPSMAELEEKAMTRILQAADHAIAARGCFHLVLAGGSTPRNVYALLREASADWAHWHIYFGDERCLPPEHPERNSHMAQEAWLESGAIPAEQIHPIPAELGAEAAANAYAKTLANVARFDLVLLGLGEDGHTASLFPGQAWEQAAELPAVMAVHAAPKPPAERVSLSPARLSATRQVLFLVTGSGKKAAVSAWQAGKHIPASCIALAAGVNVYLDSAAAG